MEVVIKRLRGAKARFIQVTGVQTQEQVRLFHLTRGRCWKTLLCRTNLTEVSCGLSSHTVGGFSVVTKGLRVSLRASIAGKSLKSSLSSAVGVVCQIWACSLIYRRPPAFALLADLVTGFAASTWSLLFALRLGLNACLASASSSLPQGLVVRLPMRSTMSIEKIPAEIQRGTKCGVEVASYALLKPLPQSGQR